MQISYISSMKSDEKREKYILFIQEQFIEHFDAEGTVDKTDHGSSTVMVKWERQMLNK